MNTNQNSDKLYFVYSDSVTIDVFQNWNKAFELMQELGRRLGFHKVKILTVTDKRTLTQRKGDI